MLYITSTLLSRPCSVCTMNCSKLVRQGDQPVSKLGKQTAIYRVYLSTSVTSCHVATHLAKTSISFTSQDRTPGSDLLLCTLLSPQMRTHDLRFDFREKRDKDNLHTHYNTSNISVKLVQ